MRSIISGCPKRHHTFLEHHISRKINKQSNKNKKQQKQNKTKQKTKTTTTTTTTTKLSSNAEVRAYLKRRDLYNYILIGLPNLTQFCNVLVYQYKQKQMATFISYHTFFSLDNNTNNCLYFNLFFF